MRFRILTDKEITEDRFREFVELDHTSWPEGDPAYLSTEYLQSLYPDRYEGLFLAVDPDTDRVAGYFNTVFTDEEHFRKYMNGSFTDLVPVGRTKGQPRILYLYAANLYPQYRGTSCMKELGAVFAAWLDELEENGYCFDDVWCETVSRDGVRTASKGFGMKPVDTDENGFGHWYNGDVLRAYRRNMRELAL